MAARTSMLHVRVGDITKLQATETLAAVRMSAADAARLFLRRVIVDQAFPLELGAERANPRGDARVSRHDGYPPR